MERNHTNGDSSIKTLSRDTKNAAVEDGATIGRWFILGTSPGQIHRVDFLFPVDSGKPLWYHCRSLEAPVAQVDRASDFESAGRRFESCRAYQ